MSGVSQERRRMVGTHHFIVYVRSLTPLRRGRQLSGWRFLRLGDIFLLKQRQSHSSNSHITQMETNVILASYIGVFFAGL